MHRSRYLPLLTLMAGLACSRAERGAEIADSSAAHQSGGAMAGMDHTEPESVGAMSAVRAHLRAMPGLGIDSLQPLMPTYRQMAANLLQQMGTEMRSMSLTGDSLWDAAVAWSARISRGCLS